MLISSGLLQACASLNDSSADSVEPCSDKTLVMIEHQAPIGEGLGHGSDIGSDEWRSVVEFRLGVRGDASVPPRNTRPWERLVLFQVTQDSTMITDQYSQGASFELFKASLARMTV